MRNPNLLSRGDLIKVTLPDTRRQQNERWNSGITKTVGQVLTVSRVTRHWLENSKNEYVKKLQFLIEVDENPFFYEADWVEYYIPNYIPLPNFSEQPKPVKFETPTQPNSERPKKVIQQTKTTQQKTKIGFTLVKSTPIVSNFQGPYAKEYEALLNHYQEEYYLG